MALENIYYIGQTIAVVAILISLVFVGLQVRQANLSMRNAARSRHAEKLQQFSRMMAESPDLGELWMKGAEGLDRLTDAERLRFVNVFTYMLRVLEELFFQFEDGLLDEDIWSANTRIMVDVYALDGVKEAWMTRRHLFTARFREFLERRVTEDKPMPLYKADSAPPAEQPA